MGACAADLLRGDRGERRAEKRRTLYSGSMRSKDGRRSMQEGNGAGLNKRQHPALVQLDHVRDAVKTTSPHQGFDSPRALYAQLTNSLVHEQLGIHGDTKNSKRACGIWWRALVQNMEFLFAYVTSM